MRIIELTDGVELSGNPPSAMTRWKVVDVDNVNTAASYALASTPSIVSTVYGILFRDDLRVKRSAYNQWMIEVPYGVRKGLGEFSWDFDTTGGQIHITQAKSEVGRYPASAPNQLGAISVDQDEVKGTEIIIPAMKLNVQFRHPLGVVTIAKAKFLSSITGTVNSDSFLTFAPGEVLFLGARGSDGSEAEATVAYQFAMAKNESGITIGGIAGIAKKAWEVAWVRYEDTVTDGGGSDYPTRVPKFVYVDRVYDTIAMSVALGFGG